MTAIYKIEKLFLSQGIIPNWLPTVEYPLHITYEEFNTTLMVRLEGVYLHVTLHSNDPYDPCLKIVIRDDDTAYISSVATDSTCMIPDSKSGTWIMKMTNAFLCSIGVKEAGIDDDARLVCNTYTYNPKILLLRIFEGRYNGWYQKFGYIPDNLTTNTQQIMKELHDFQTKLLFTETVKSNHKYYNLNPEQIHVLLEKYPPGQMKLGDYMISIWNKNCKDYSILEEFIRLTNGSWSPLIKMIEDNGTGINKDICRKSKKASLLIFYATF